LDFNDPSKNPLWILEKIGKNFVQYFHVLNSKRKLTVFTLPKLDKSDPTYTFQPSTIDTFLYQLHPDNNYGTLTELDVKSHYNSGDNTHRNARTLLKFDLTSQIPAGATINSAVLSLYYYDYDHAGSDPSGRTYWTYRLTQTAWTETGSTWNKYDGTNSWTTPGGDYTVTDGASATLPTAPAWISWTVTAQVQYAVNNVGRIAHFLIKDGTEDSSTNYNPEFYSREYTGDTTKCPKLYVDWTSGVTQNISEDPATVGICAGGASVTENATTTGQQAVASISLMALQAYSYVVTIPLFQAASELGQPATQSLIQDAAVELFTYQVTIPLFQTATETATAGVVTVTLSAEVGIESFTYTVTIPLLQESSELGQLSTRSLMELTVESFTHVVTGISHLIFITDHEFDRINITEKEFSRLNITCEERD
jgi:hypothetical protein